MKTLAERAEINAKKGFLSVEQVVRIRLALAKGERPAEIAILYGVSEQTICRIRDRKTWAWLPDSQTYLPVNIGKAEELGAKASLERLGKLMAEAGEGDGLLDELRGGKS